MKNRATRTFYRNNGTVNVKLTSGKDINDERAELNNHLDTAILPLSLIDHFTVLCAVTWPLNGSEARGDLVLIPTSLLSLSKSSFSNANQTFA